MTAAAAELQRALFVALADDAPLTSLLGGPKIYDRAPAHAAFPYLTFGRTDLFDWSTATETGAEVLVSLHAWSKSEGRKEALAIVEAARALLHEATLTIDGHRLISLRATGAETLYDEDLAVHHGVLRLRALIEATA